MLEKLAAIEKKLEKLESLAAVAEKLEDQIWIIEKLGQLMQTSSLFRSRFLMDEQPRALIE